MHLRTLLSSYLKPFQSGDSESHAPTDESDYLGTAPATSSMESLTQQASLLHATWQKVYPHFDLVGASFRDKSNITAWIVLGLGLYTTYVFGLVFYRLYLHPLAKFPGYKICAASEWYEFYCYIVKGGQWGNEIRKMHEEYGKFTSDELLSLAPGSLFLLPFFSRQIRSWVADTYVTFCRPNRAHQPLGALHS